MQAQHTISVVICAYTEKRWEDLFAAVESVQHQTVSPKEIIVVIDHNPSLLKRVRKCIPDVLAIENQQAKGLSGARNSGALIAHGTIVAFIDDDAVATSNWIENLIECYSDSYVAGVCGKIEPLWLEARPAWFPAEFGWVVGCTYQGMPTEKAAVRNMIGANMSVRRQILITVGGFRESFGCNYKNTSKGQAHIGIKWLQHHAGDEETEFCIRVAQQRPHTTWLYTPKAVIQHRVPAQRTHWTYFLWRCYDEGLGKAMLVGLHGTQSGLSSERTYAFRTLPRGVIHGLTNALRYRDPTGLARAGAIVIGLTTTMVGYLMGTLSQLLTRRSSMTRSSDFEPVRMLEIEIGQPLPHIHAFDDKTSRHYRRANCLIRLHSQPLGIVELQLDENGISPHTYAKHIWHTLHAQILEHLQQDGLPLITQLDATGLSSSSTTRCIEERERIFAHAPFVSIIVPTHDRPERIPGCLRSLQTLHYPHFEIIIVDNAPSTSATADFIQQTYRDSPQVRYVREDHPGLSWAHNCGRRVARGEILAFTDDDVVVDPYWLIELVRGFSFADNIGCVTGLVLPLELETPAQLWFEESGGFNKGFTHRVYDMRENRPSTPLYPYTAGRFGTGANMAFTAAFLDSVGGFDLALGPGTPAQNGEDLATFFQVITRGYTLVYTPAALLYHLHRRDYSDLYKQIHTYGVGLTAYLTKSVLENPRLLFDFVTKLPYGLYFTLNARSPKNQKKSTHYPKELTKVEWKGMLYGPFAYLRSRRAVQKTRKVSGSREYTILTVKKER